MDRKQIDVQRQHLAEKSKAELDAICQSGDLAQWPLEAFAAASELLAERGVPPIRRQVRAVQPAVVRRRGRMAAWQIFLALVALWLLLGGIFIPFYTYRHVSPAHQHAAQAQEIMDSPYASQLYRSDARMAQDRVYAANLCLLSSVLMGCILFVLGGWILCRGLLGYRA